MSSSLLSGGPGNGFLPAVVEERTQRVGLLFLALASSSLSGSGSELLDFVVTSVGQGLNTYLITTNTFTHEFVH